jgi:AraC-like DNA-binding protein
MENELDGIQGDFKRLVEGNDKQLYCRTVPIMPACRVALQQMLGCPYHGPVKQLFLESRALELIAYQLKLLTTPKGTGRQGGALRGGDIERVHAVAEILKKNLDDPPGIRELTRATGLTHIKLQRGFREIYDTTPFGYLRLIRMNKAKALMEEQDLNVTETALSVGYASLSHFAKAFKEHFGISPSQYRKQRCL